MPKQRECSRLDIIRELAKHDEFNTLFVETLKVWSEQGAKKKQTRAPKVIAVRPATKLDRATMIKVWYSSTWLIHCDECKTTRVTPISAQFIAEDPTDHKTIRAVCEKCYNGKPKERQMTRPRDKRRLQTWINTYGRLVQAYCWCCGKRKLHVFGKWHQGHILARAHGGTATEDNLRAICNFCNADMNTENMMDYMEKHGY